MNSASEPQSGESSASKREAPVTSKFDLCKSRFTIVSIVGTIRHKGRVPVYTTVEFTNYSNRCQI